MQFFTPIALNQWGRRIGEGHPRARLTDHEIDLMREMHEQHPVGDPKHLGYKKLARMFEVDRSQVRHICHYRQRAQTAARFKKKGCT